MCIGLYRNSVHCHNNNHIYKSLFIIQLNMDTGFTIMRHNNKNQNEICDIKEGEKKKTLSLAPYVLTYLQKHETLTFASFEYCENVMALFMALSVAYI